MGSGLRIIELGAKQAMRIEKALRKYNISLHINWLSRDTALAQTFDQSIPPRLQVLDLSFRAQMHMKVLFVVVNRDLLGDFQREKACIFLRM